MNQILKPHLNNNYDKENIPDQYDYKKKVKLKIFMKFQLYISIILIIVVGGILISNTINLYKQEKYSSQVLDNYNITRLYANLYSNDSESTIENNDITYVIGIINIPSINIYYPIFSNCNEDLLKVSPCRLYGPLPGKDGNLCIAGHNYDNDKFFSQIKNLNLNDEIFIYNNKDEKFSYKITNIYEVNHDDVSPIYDYDYNLKQLTLITCNNLNNNRIIIRAILQ